MKKINLSILSLLFCISSVFAQKKEKTQQDRDAIKSMVGCYKVTFEFAETFAADTNYKYHDRKFDWGIEYVVLVEDSEKKISLQHLLIINDSTIIKHWRQDWIYENTTLLSYYKDNTWKKVKLNSSDVKGSWTQKVYQVDDSPRYEGKGTWVHTDGKHFWEGSADAPLPRREFTKRSDYNVLKRHNRMELTNYGWIFEQDNQKIIRENTDKLLCWEKGFEKFSRGNHDCQPAVSWWEKNKTYWADVRKVWDQVYTENDVLQFEKKIDNKLLFEQLFKLGDEAAKSKSYNSAESIVAIRQTIEKYLVKDLTSKY